VYIPFVDISDILAIPRKL